MTRFTDQKYLLDEQYKDASKLTARIRLHKKFSTNKTGWMKWVFDQFRHLADGSQILELGCGPGELWKDNDQRIPRSWQITLSDFSPGMVARAQEELAALDRPFQYEVIDVQSIPFEDEHFDAVLANHMLFFVPDRPRALSEIRRVLRPGGWLFATTVGREHLREMRELTARFDPDAERSSAADQFGLENGPDQLRPYFGEVSVRIYPDSLLVDEVEPLVEAILSSDRSAKIRAERDLFAAMVRDEMARSGVIQVTKEVGMLVARKGQGER